MKSGMNLKFELPTCWQHGPGIVSQIGTILQEYGCSKPLIVTDKLLISLGVVSPVFKSLEQERIPYTVCDSVDKEPTVAMIDSIAKSLDLRSFDSVIAVGGGSVIDVSKGLTILGTFGGTITDYDGFDKFPAKPDLKVFAIPTTAGTGSEVSDGSVVIDEQRNTKFVVISNHLRPEVAITDPEMTKSMPPKVTACTGIDALIHAIEAYLSIKANMATDLFALKSIELIAQGLVPAYQNGEDIAVREKMQLGATMAMVAASNTHVGMCHAIDGPICALYHIPHGQGCGLVAPAVLKFNAEVSREKVVNIFRTMGFIEENTEDSAAIEMGCDKLTELLDKVGLLIRLRDIGFQESHIENIAKETLKTAQLRTNPRQPTEKDIETILREIA
jgi:alcohol dehydrogenase class IV